MHYFVAYGEYDQFTSDKDNFHVHFLKQLKDEEEFLQYIVAESLKELFMNHVNIGDLPKIMLANASMLFNKMLLAEFENDHKYPVLYGYYYKNHNCFEDIFAHVIEKVKRAAKFLMEDAFLQKLFYCDKLNFYQVEEGVAFAELGDVRIYTDLLFQVCLNGKNYFVSFDREDRDFIRFFHLYYGVNKKHMRIESIKSVLIDTVNCKVNVMDNYDLNISETIDEICRNYAEIPKFDCNFDYRYIERTPDLSKCELCRFKEICIK